MLLFKQGSPFTVLHIAALRGKEETVTILLHYGANINKADNDVSGTLFLGSIVVFANAMTFQGIRIPSPLHYACSSKRDTIVKMLLDAGANINARDQVSHFIFLIAGNTWYLLWIDDIGYIA